MKISYLLVRRKDFKRGARATLPVPDPYLAVAAQAVRWLGGLDEVFYGLEL